MAKIKKKIKKIKKIKILKSKNKKALKPKKALFKKLKAKLLVPRIVPGLCSSLAWHHYGLELLVCAAPQERAEGYKFLRTPD